MRRDCEVHEDFLYDDQLSLRQLFLDELIDRLFVARCASLSRKRGLGLHAVSVKLRPSVCLSVCHVREFCQNE